MHRHIVEQGPRELSSGVAGLMNAWQLNMFGEPRWSEGEGANMGGTSLSGRGATKVNACCDVPLHDARFGGRGTFGLMIPP